MQQLTTELPSSVKIIALFSTINHSYVVSSIRNYTYAAVNITMHNFNNSTATGTLLLYISYY